MITEQKGSNMGNDAYEWIPPQILADTKQTTIMVGSVWLLRMKNMLPAYLPAVAMADESTDEMVFHACDGEEYFDIRIYDACPDDMHALKAAALLLPCPPFFDD